MYYAHVRSATTAVLFSNLEIDVYCILYSYYHMASITYIGCTNHSTSSHQPQHERVSILSVQTLLAILASLEHIITNWWIFHKLAIFVPWSTGFSI